MLFRSSQNICHACPEQLTTCPIKEIKINKKKKVKVIQQFSANPNRHLSINAAPIYIYDNNKKQTLIIEVIRDLSEDIKFSHQQKLSSLGFLATSVAHEMKNHLGSIRMITENILTKHFESKPDDDQSKQLMMLIYKQLIECIKVPAFLSFSKNTNDAISAP